MKFHEQDQDKFGNSQKAQLQLLETIDQFSDEFLSDFIDELDNRIRAICNLIVKDETELFKFLSFVLNFMISFPLERGGFPQLMFFMNNIFQQLSEQNFDSFINCLNNYFLSFLQHKLNVLSQLKQYFLLKALSYTFQNDTVKLEKMISFFFTEKRFHRQELLLIQVITERVFEQ